MGVHLLNEIRATRGHDRALVAASARESAPKEGTRNAWDRVADGLDKAGDAAAWAALACEKGKKGGWREKIVKQATKIAEKVGGKRGKQIVEGCKTFCENRGKAVAFLKGLAQQARSFADQKHQQQRDAEAKRKEVEAAAQKAQDRATKAAIDKASRDFGRELSRPGRMREYRDVPRGTLA